MLHNLYIIYLYKLNLYRSILFNLIRTVNTIAAKREPFEIAQLAPGRNALKVDPAETRTPVGRTLCKKYEAYIEIKVGIVIPVEFRIRLQLDLVSTDLPTL